MIGDEVQKCFILVIYKYDIYKCKRSTSVGCPGFLYMNHVRLATKNSGCERWLGIWNCCQFELKKVKCRTKKAREKFIFCVRKCSVCEILANMKYNDFDETTVNKQLIKISLKSRMFLSVKSGKI